MSSYPVGGPPPRQPGPSRLVIVLVPLVAVLVLAAAVGAGLLARTAMAETIPGTAAPVGAGSAPANVSADGSVRIGEPDAAVTVRVVMDLQCPYCKAFEEANGTVLEDAVRDGTAAVEYSVISFLDRASTTQYSSRAGNAAFCVADSGLDNYQTWLAKMFADQPEEGGSGLPDSELIEIAEATGYADSTVADCITDRRYDLYLRMKTDEVLAGGVDGTPAVFVNDEEVTDPEAILGQDGLAPVIAAAR